MAKDKNEYSEKEIRKMFLNHVWATIKYWESLPGKDANEKCEGVAFSILSTLDGSSADLPQFIVAPNPHPSDKQYLLDNGERYFPENYDANIKGNISGSLHELFHDSEPKKKK